MADKEKKNNKKIDNWRDNKKDERDSFYKAFTVFCVKDKRLRTAPRIEKWLNEISRFERILMFPMFKKIDSLSGAMIISVIADKKTKDERRIVATSFGLFNTSLLKQKYDEFFLNFELKSPEKAEIIENWLSVLSKEEVDFFRFSIGEMKQHVAEKMLFSLANKVGQNEMSKLAKLRNILS